MAKFCKYCGAPLEEGQTCTCPESQAAAAAVANPAEAAAPAAPVATAVAQGAAGAKAKALLLEVKNVLLAYVKSPRDAAQVAMNSENHLAIAGVLAGVNAIAALLYIWRLFAQLLGTIGGIASNLGVKIQYPFLAMLVTAIVLTVVFIGMSGLALFVCAKIAKRKMEIKYAMEIASVASIASTVLLLLGIILGFISWQMQLLCLVLSAIIWCANGLADIHDYTALKANNSLKEMGILVLTVIVVAAICLMITGKLSVWCIGEISINGDKLADAIQNGLGDLMGELF